jgi:O-acetyl-ADP-ribose deacetylase (regulator of RNase III)
MINIKQGDITEATEDLIAHQVNCKNVMGSGVAKALFTKYPDVLAKYRWFNERTEEHELLGKVDIFTAFSKDHSTSKKIANCYSQFDYGSDGKLYTDYNAVNKCFKYIAENFKGTVAVPYLYGCGLGGGDWSIVYSLIVANLGNRVTFYKLD